MRLLLMDTCGETGSIALANQHDGAASIVTSEELPSRAASAELLPALRRCLANAGWKLDDMEAVGVVSGPGSFTGVRVGLAAAKGLCEARGLPLAAVSRLEVLADVARLERGFAVLDAGGGELYVRRVEEGTAGEFLSAVDDLLGRADGERIVIAEERLLAPLAALRPELFAFNAVCALHSVLRALQEGGSDLASVDANYVRSERQIYGKASRQPTQETAT